MLTNLTTLALFLPAVHLIGASDVAIEGRRLRSRSSPRSRCSPRCARRLRSTLVGEPAQRVLARMNAWLVRHSRAVGAIVCFGFAVLLAVQGIEQLSRRSVARALGAVLSADYTRGVWRSMMRSKSVPAGSVPKALAPVAAEARGAEGVGDGRVAEADQQRALERERHALDDAPRAGLDRLEVGELVAQRGDVGVEPRVGARGLVDLGEERLDRGRAAGHRRAARRGTGRCPSPPRSRPAASRGRAAACPTPRRSRCRRGTRAPRPRAPAPRLQIQYLSTALARRLNSVAFARRRRCDLVVGARAGAAPRSSRPRTRRRGRRARCCISGWSTSSLPNAERWAAWWIAVRDAGAHPGRRADRAVEPRVVDHLDDRRHAAALLADQPRPGAAELDLARGVGAVAELVLEALDVDRVALAVGREARHQEARQPAVGLREDEERVAHRRREEPLVAGDLVLGAGPAAVQRAAPSSCWRARRSRPASRSSPSRTARRPCRAPGPCARRSRATGSAAPTPRRARAACAAPGSPSRSSRSGSRRRPRPGRAA